MGTVNQAAATVSLTGSLPAQTRLRQGRYELLVTVGQGGFGAVYKASDTRFRNRPVAIKEMSQRGLTPQELVVAEAAFEEEAQLLASLMHPNLPRIYDAFTEQGHSFLVMDYIEGDTLVDYAKASRGRLPVLETLGIGIQLCEVLDYLHSQQPQIVFRDLKPANVMRTPAGHLYLIDFGIARHFKPGQARDTVALGSVGYAAPEQYGKAQTDGRADIYSLAATLHTLLSGDDPADSPFQFGPVPGSGQQMQQVNALLVRMLSIPVDQRPATALEARQALADITQGRAPAVPVVQGAAGQASSVSPVRMPGSGVGAGLLVCKHMHPGWVLSLSWSPDGSEIASLGVDAQLRVWNAISGAQRFCSSPIDGGAKRVAWSPDGSRILVGVNQLVLTWDARKGSRTTEYCSVRSTGNEMRSLVWSPAGNRCAVSGSLTEVSVLQVGVVSGKLEVKRTFRGHDGAVPALAWSPDGEYLASGGGQGTKGNRYDTKVRVRRAEYDPILVEYSRHKRDVLALAWSPDGSRIASGDADGRVHVWDAQTGDLLTAYDGHSAAVSGLCWSPDATLVASASLDKTVHVWDAQTGAEQFTYTGHLLQVNAVEWSPDGSCLASASNDKTVQVWRLP